MDDTPIPTLKSCPFCGSSAQLFEITAANNPNPMAHGWCVECDFCTGLVDRHDSASNAVQHWNSAARSCAAAALVEVEAAKTPIGSVHSVAPSLTSLPLVSEPGATEVGHVEAKEILIAMRKIKPLTSFLCAESIHDEWDALFARAEFATNGYEVNS